MRPPSAKRGVPRFLVAGLLCLILPLLHPLAPCADPVSPDLERALARCDSLRLSGKYAESEQAARALLAELTAGSDSLTLAATYVVDQVARSISTGGGGTPENISLVKRSLAVRTAALGPDHPDVATSHMVLGWILEEAGNYVGSRAQFEKALAIREAKLEPNDSAIARCLVSVANVRARVGDYAGLDSLYERALRIQKTALGPEDRQVATVMLNHAILKKITGDYRGAQDLYEQVLDLRIRTLGPEHPAVARTYHNLGNVLMYTGDYEGARAAYEQAIEIRERALGPDHLHVARTLKGLAILQYKYADLLEARAVAERSLHIYEQALGPDHPDLANTLLVLAEITAELGDLAAAEDTFLRSMAVQEAALGPDHPRTAEVIRALAHYRRRAGDTDGAEELLRQALDIQERSFGNEHAEVSRTLSEIGQLQMLNGDLESAEAVLTRSLTIREHATGLGNSEAVTSLHALGETTWLRGDLERAQAHLQRALAIADTTLGQDHPFYGYVLHQLGYVLSDRGEARRALEVSLRAEQLARRHLRLTTRGLPERLALLYAEREISGLDLALSLACDSPPGPSAVRSVWNELIRSRALVLDEMALRHQVLGQRDDAAVVELQRELAETSRELAWLLASSPDAGSSRQFRQRFAVVRARKDAAERGLAERSPAFRRELNLAVVTLDDVIRSLPPGSALLAYVRYAHHTCRSDPTELGDKSTWFGQPAYAALVMGPGDREPTAVALGSVAEIDLLITRWRDELGYGARIPGRSDAESEAACRRVGLGLRRAIWDPIAQQLETAAHVFIVPDGLLHLVNLAALPGDDDGYLLDDPVVFHGVSAERDLASGRRTVHRKSGLLVLGAPDFDALRSELPPVPTRVAALEQAISESAGDVADLKALTSLREGTFTPLPASAREVREIAQLWEEVFRKSGDPAAPAAAEGRAVQLTGMDANEATFKALAGEFRILHLATHGFYLGGNRTLPAPNQRGVAGLHAASGAPATPLQTENPLLLSGLALAGANTRDQTSPENEDGLLTAEEIATLDLSGVEWAVLSACESGLGETRASEGVLGLRRAFQVAGAGTVVMSLWAIEDEVAREWMTHLYRARLIDGLSSSESVRHASRQLLARRRATGPSSHPYYWAGFIAWGEWR
jgi:CHAT domain-containing protein/tetratricopeptide (TPR) repeat protein